MASGYPAHDVVRVIITTGAGEVLDEFPVTDWEVEDVAELTGDRDGRPLPHREKH